MSRQETTTRFKVGQKFSGEQALGGAYTAVASWDEDRFGCGWKGRPGVDTSCTPFGEAVRH